MHTHAPSHHMRAPGPFPQTGTARGSLLALGQNHEPKVTLSKLTQAGSESYQPQKTDQDAQTPGGHQAPQSATGRRVSWPGVEGVQPSPRMAWKHPQPPFTHLPPAGGKGCRLSPRQAPVSRVSQGDSWGHPGASAPRCPRTASSHPSVPRPYLDPQPGQEHQEDPAGLWSPGGLCTPQLSSPGPATSY